MQPIISANAFSHVETSHISSDHLSLLVNKGKFTSLFISGIFVRVLIPVFILHVLLIKGFSWEGLTYWTFFIPGIGLIGAAFFYHIQKKRDQLDALSLSISNDSLFLSWKNESVQEFPLAALQVEEIGWGPDVDSLLPAIRLQAEGMPTLTVGTMEASSYWTNHRKSVECVDFIIEDEQGWKELMRWVKD